MAQHFASDNNAGVCPEAMAAFERANATGHELSYGDDRWTQAVCDRMRAIFETDCEVFFVFNGTAANALALASLCRPFQSVICHDVSHVETDECGAPEFFTGGSKLLAAGGELGKLTAATVEAVATKRSDLHFQRPKAVSVTQSTEMGTVYSIDEIKAIAAVAKRHGLKVHMDGARFANAVAHLGCHPADVACRAGVDVLSFGGTKNGLAVGEAVVFFDRELAGEFAARVKQAGQLASKMRFVSAPWLGLLENDVWLENARHANAMAQRLRDRIAPLPGVGIMYPCEANAVFAEIPPQAQAAVRAKGWRFYTFVGETGCRLMCAWDTAPETVDRFAADLATALTETAGARGAAAAAAGRR